MDEINPKFLKALDVGGFGISYREETPGQVQDMLGRLVSPPPEKLEYVVQEREIWSSLLRLLPL